jgi:hypothetical protein
MRIFIVLIAILGAFTGAADADDASSPIVGKLPDNSRSHQLYLFTLKKNGLSIRMSPQDFCGQLGYGEPIKWSKDPKDNPDDDKGFWERASDEYGKDGKVKATGELIWVICEITPPVKPPHKPDTDHKTEPKP